MAANTFRDHDIEFVTCNVDIQQKCPEEQAYMMLGVSLGASKARQEKPTRNLMQAWQAAHERHIAEEEARLHDDRIKILVVGHSYNLYDEYIGKPILKGSNSWMQFRSVPMQWI